MDVSHIIDGLNDAQRAAVTAPMGSALVLAGAGSGKTRVLVHRIAWLIQVEGLPPWGILAVTFTNKAAREMRHRIEDLLGQPVGGMWVGTFHGLAHRLLRAHWQEAGLSKDFQILDSDDQLRLVKRVIRNLDLDEARWVPKQQQWFINARKDEGQRPQHIEHKGDPYLQQQVRIYQAYEELCQRSGLVDFAELLLRAHELWRDNAELLAHYQRRFTHLLVDEFQDTDPLQYEIVLFLAEREGGRARDPFRAELEPGRLFIVGDPKQSIYRFREAEVGLFLEAWSGALGGVPLEDFQRRQRQYRDGEIAAMLDVPAFINKGQRIYGYPHFVNDVGGSLCELDEPGVIDLLVDEQSTSLAELERFIGRPIKLQVEALYTQEQYDVVLM